jgi:hypothetical protein
MHAMVLLHTATMPLHGAMAPTLAMCWWWSSETSWVSNTSWVACAGQHAECSQPIEVAAEPVPDILSRARRADHISEVVCFPCGSTRVQLRDVQPPLCIILRLAQPPAAAELDAYHPPVRSLLLAVGQDTPEPMGMRPRVPPVLTMAHCSSVLQRSLRINAMAATAGDVRMQHTQRDP